MLDRKQTAPHGTRTMKISDLVKESYVFQEFSCGAHELVGDNRLLGTGTEGIAFYLFDGRLVIVTDGPDRKFRIRVCELRSDGWPVPVVQMSVGNPDLVAGLLDAVTLHAGWVDTERDILSIRTPRSTMDKATTNILETTFQMT